MKAFPMIIALFYVIWKVAIYIKHSSAKKNYLFLISTNCNIQRLCQIALSTYFTTFVYCLFKSLLTYLLNELYESMQLIGKQLLPRVSSREKDLYLDCSNFSTSHAFETLTAQIAEFLNHFLYKTSVFSRSDHHLSK